jgi:hypothetical protein
VYGFKHTAAAALAAAAPAAAGVRAVWAPWAKPADLNTTDETIQFLCVLHLHAVLLLLLLLLPVRYPLLWQPRMLADASAETTASAVPHSPSHLPMRRPYLGRRMLPNFAMP